MQRDGCELAHRRLVQAFYFDGTLSVFATGHVPVPGYEVRIARVAVHAEPPQFAIVQRRLAGIYPETPTPFTISCLFAMGTCPRQITVSHAEGKDAVTVFDVRDENTLPATAAGTLPIPYVFPPSASRSVRNEGMATGYSATLDFNEALSEAIRGLPPIADSIAEYPRTIRVVEVGIEEGGVANFHHLFVRVQRHVVPAHGGSDESR